MWSAITSIFSGNGGTIRGAILAITMLAITGTVIENQCELSGETSNGDSFRFRAKNTSSDTANNSDVTD